MSDQETPPPGDHRSAKASAKAAKAHSKAMRPWYKKKRFILSGIILVVIIAAVAGSGGGDDTDTATATDGGSENDDSSDVDSMSGNSENPPQNDVEVSACGVEEFSGPEATLNVTNNSSGRSNYIIEVSFESEDGAQQYGTGTAILNNLEPGQSKTETASAFEEVPEGASFTCRLVEVDRFAS